MQRLFAGTPRHTDGTLTEDNFRREAQVSRATMNRAVDIFAEWDARVADSPAGVAVRHRRMSPAAPFQILFPTPTSEGGWEDGSGANRGSRLAREPVRVGDGGLVIEAVGCWPRRTG
jgi:hypothetical protein